MALLAYSPTGSILLDVTAVLTLLYLYFSIRSYYRLNHIPGPKLWAWTKLPLFRIHLNGETYNKFGEFGQAYGPLVRVGPNFLLCSDPDVLRRMSAARSPYVRSPWYICARLIPGKDNVLSVLNETRHEELRRKMAMGYSGKENLTLEGDIDGCVLDLVNLVDRKYANPPNRSTIKLDLARKMNMFTSDIMSKVAFDAKFNDCKDDHDNYGYINEIETVFPSIFPTSLFPDFLNWMSRVGLLQLVAPSEGSKLGFGKILGITKGQISKRFDSDGKVIGGRQDMLASFLRHGLTQREAEQEAVLQLAAGSDTTATGLRGTLLSLIMQPRALTRLRAELDAAVAAGKISSDPDAIISDEQARKMPYLQACIKEGLRWYPPIAGMLPKRTPPQGDTIAGYAVPGGVDIAYNANGVHHSKELFGPDEYSFRPERFIHVSEGGDEPSWEKVKALDRNNELVFGYGKYMCLGKNIAFMELNKVVAELIRRFDFSVVNPLKPWTTTCYGIHLQKDMWVIARRRETGEVAD